MNRTIAAVFTTAGFLLAVGAAQAAQPIPKPGPVPPGAQARLACNNIKDPAQRKACIDKACANVPASLKGACVAGVGPFAAKPPVKPPIKKPIPVVRPKPPVKPPVGKPTVALLNQKRAQLNKLRSEVVNLCRQVYEGKAELACIAAAFPGAPKGGVKLPPVKKPTN